MATSEWPEGVSDGLVSPCGICEKPGSQCLDYTVTDEAWSNIVPIDKRAGVVCLDCLGALAGGPIGHHLIRVQWVGDGETVELKPTRHFDWRRWRDG